MWNYMITRRIGAEEFKGVCVEKGNHQLFWALNDLPYKILRQQPFDHKSIRRFGGAFFYYIFTLYLDFNPCSFLALHTFEIQLAF